MKNPYIAPLLATAFAAFPFTTQGAILVYEGFQYSNVGDDFDNVTSTDVAPIGLAGTWDDSFQNTEMFIKSGSLNFSNLAGAGNHIGYSSNSNQDVFHNQLTTGVGGAATTISTIGASNGTIYFSFMFEKLQNNFGADHEGFALMDSILPAARFDGSNNPGATGRHGFAVAATNNSNLRAVAYNGTTGTRVVSDGTGGTTDFSISTPAANGGTNTSGSNLGGQTLIVGQISFNTGTAGADVFTLFSVADDGDLDATDLTSLGSIEADVDESLLDTLNLTRQVNVNYDEVRIGTTMADVLVAIPEPSAALLGGLGCLLLLRRRR